MIVIKYVHKKLKEMCMVFCGQSEVNGRGGYDSATCMQRILHTYAELRSVSLKVCGCKRQKVAGWHTVMSVVTRLS